MSMGLILIVGVVVVVGLVFMVLLGVLIPVLMNNRKTYSEDDTPVEENPKEEVDKKEILEMLANKEISQEEAERKLAE